MLKRIFGKQKHCCAKIEFQFHNAQEFFSLNWIRKSPGGREKIKLSLNGFFFFLWIQAAAEYSHLNFLHIIFMFSIEKCSSMKSETNSAGSVKSNMKILNSSNHAVRDRKKLYETFFKFSEKIEDGLLSLIRFGSMWYWGCSGFIYNFISIVSDCFTLRKKKSRIPTLFHFGGLEELQISKNNFFVSRWFLIKIVIVQNNQFWNVFLQLPSKSFF